MEKIGPKRNFNERHNDTTGEVTIGDIAIPKVEKCQGDVSYIVNGTQANTLFITKRRDEKNGHASSMLCDKKILLRIKRKVYRTAIVLVLLHG